MALLKTYNANQLNLVSQLTNSLNDQGITNPVVQAAILSVISKETNYTTLKETCYNNTSNARIRLIFLRARSLTDAQIDALKKDCKAFFNYVYNGAKFGNKEPEDGYKYVGRGFNGITGRSNYESIGKQLGLDLLKNPELLENPKIAAKATAIYFKNAIAAGIKNNIIKNRYNVDDLYKISDPVLAAKIIFNLNAGLGNDTRSTYWLNNDGYKIMMQRLPEFLTYAKNQSKDDNINLASSALLGLLALGFFIVNR